MLTISLKLADRCFLLLSAQTGCRTLRFLRPGWWDWPGLVRGVQQSCGFSERKAFSSSAAGNRHAKPGSVGSRLEAARPQWPQDKMRCCCWGCHHEARRADLLLGWRKTASVWFYTPELPGAGMHASVHWKYMHEHIRVCVVVVVWVCEECCLKGEERRVTPTVTATAHQLCRGPEGDSRMLE